MANKNNENLYDEYKAHSVDNEIEILNSEKCGCVFCRSLFDARKISDWISDENGVSAICPECGMDAVIGDASGVPLSKELLKSMNLAYYGFDYMERNPEAAQTYCHRYAQGKITHKIENERLFIKYASMLADGGDPEANLALGFLYYFGSEFTEPNYSLAAEYFSAPSLMDNCTALCNLGRIHYQNLLGASSKISSKSAYLCFSKAAALGSLEAVYLFADCYIYGVFVEKDPHFAFSLLAQGYEEAYEDVVFGHKGWDVFPEFAYRIAKCYQRGTYPYVSDSLALRFYLIAHAAYGYKETFTGSVTDPNILDDIVHQIGSLGAKYKLETNPMAFDEDTFLDSFDAPGADEKSSKTLRFEGFNEEEGELSFSIDYSVAQFLVDVGNMAAGFAPTSIRWTFHDVSSVRMPASCVYERLDFDGNDTIRFLHTEEDGSEIAVAEIFFRSETPLKLKTVVHPTHSKNKK